MAMDRLHETRRRPAAVRIVLLLAVVLLVALGVTSVGATPGPQRLKTDTAVPMENQEQAGSNVDDSAAPPGGVAEDPTGSDETKDAAQTVDDQVAACEALGGAATVNAQRPGSILEVHCTGGMLDRMICYGTICNYFAAAPGGSGEDARIPTTGEVAQDSTGTTTSEITFVRVETMAELEEALLAENPDGGETVVIYNQVGSPIGLASLQVAMCRAAGGKATQSETRTVGNGQETAMGCTGGLLDGMVCINAEKYSVCLYRVVTPEEPQVTPAAGVEAQVAPTPTPVVVVTEVSAPPTPTVAPPPPTLAPTAVAAEPTVAPPSDPPPPKNDNSVPPGGLEDPIAPEPTPTPVVLT